MTLTVPMLLPNRDRLIWVQRCTVIVFIILGADFLWQCYGYWLYEQLKHGTSPEHALGQFALLTHVLDWIRGAILLGFVLSFVGWWHRMTMNYIRIGHPMSETPLMMLVWWFLWVILPLFWWWRPYAFLIEASALLTGHAPASIRPLWAWCMLGLIFSIIPYFIINSARLPNEYELVIVLRGFGDVALILSTRLLFPTMAFIQRAQEEYASSMPEYAVPNLK